MAEVREDGYINALNKYGTATDNSEAYEYQAESMTNDMQLTNLYETNGLFAKIIDLPANEAVKRGFDLKINDEEVNSLIDRRLDDLDYEEVFATAIKWARLYGGALAVMVLDDGGELEDPVNWKKLKGVDELRVYDRSVVMPDLTFSLSKKYKKGGEDKVRFFDQPEYYTVTSQYGQFIVHESRCLVFKNGRVPERTVNQNYRYWGLPEYIRIRRALRETTTTYSNAVKMLERASQAVYSMKNLAQLLLTDDGENAVVKRLETIDMARNLMNSIAIDADGEAYEFKQFTFTGVNEIIESCAQMLSALTNIPQTLLFGRAPAGMNATGESDLENYYNYVEKIQKTMMRRNARKLLDAVLVSARHSGDIKAVPDYELAFKPLWSLSEVEQANLDSVKASTEATKAQTAATYVEMQVLAPEEVRRRLSSDTDFEIEDVISEEDMSEDIMNELFRDEEEPPEQEEKPPKKDVEKQK